MRKPIELEMAGLLTPRERVWRAARKLRKFTMLELQDAALPLVAWHTTKTYAQVLCKVGFIEAVDTQGRASNGGSFGEVQYRLVKDSFEAPRITRAGSKVTQGTATLAMWRAMKALKEFDYHDIQRAASLGKACMVTAQTAKAYVVLLARADYFRTITPSKPGTAARYRLVRDTGAHAPAITRRKAVFDRNTGAFPWQQTEQEVCDGLE